MGYHVTSRFKNALPGIVSVLTKHSLRKEIFRGLCLMGVDIGINFSWFVEIPSSKNTSCKGSSIGSGNKLCEGNKSIRKFFLRKFFFLSKHYFKKGNNDGKWGVIQLVVWHINAEIQHTYHNLLFSPQTVFLFIHCICT